MKTELIKKQYAKGTIITLTFLSIGYAVMRYQIFGIVPWKDLPIFVLNKGISLASLLLLTINFSMKPLKNLGVRISESRLDTKKSIGLIGFLYAFIHILMSITILNPKYYDKFFMDDGSLSINGGLSILGGILSFILLWVYNINFKPILIKDKRIISIISSKTFIIYAMLFMSVHLFFMGYSGWTSTVNWPGGMPPISLISFSIFFLGLLINIMGRK